MNSPRNEQQLLEDGEAEMIDKYWRILYAEEDIDPDDTLYLFTWSPDPKQLPDCSFNDQHLYLHDYVLMFLKGTRVGAVCVEGTQRGNPHYHGWYQQSDGPLEHFRISIAKSLDKMGQLKITESIGKYKINNYHTPHCNCLYYYKKDAMTKMLYVPHSVITHESLDLKPHLPTYLFNVRNMRQTAEQVEARESQFRKLIDFYSKDYAKITMI